MFGLLLVALVPLGGLALCLLFLLAVYILGGRKKDHLEAGAKALRDAGVTPAVRSALERLSNRDAGSS